MQRYKDLDIDREIYWTRYRYRHSWYIHIYIYNMLCYFLKTKLDYNIIYYRNMDTAYICCIYVWYIHVLIYIYTLSNLRPFFFRVFQYVPFFRVFQKKRYHRCKKGTQVELSGNPLLASHPLLNFFHANWFQLMTCRSQLIVHCIAPSSCKSTLVNWVAWMWTTNHQIFTGEILLVIF